MSGLSPGPVTTILHVMDPAAPELRVDRVVVGRAVERDAHGRGAVQRRRALRMLPRAVGDVDAVRGGAGDDELDLVGDAGVFDGDGVAPGRGAVPRAARDAVQFWAAASSLATPLAMPEEVALAPVLPVLPPLAATAMTMMAATRPPAPRRTFRAVCRLRRGGCGGPGGGPRAAAARSRALPSGRSLRRLVARLRPRLPLRRVRRLTCGGWPCGGYCWPPIRRW